jgi:cytochrome c oxidase subunit 3
MPVALEHAPVLELEAKLPGGGGPGGREPDEGGGGGGGRDDDGRKGALYRIGLVLTLVSVGSLFGTLILIYYTRSRAPLWWEPIQPPRALWLSTGILLGSSVVLELARRSLERREWFVYRRRLAVTSYLGFAFLTCQALALKELIERGIRLDGNPHASLFWVFAGAHAAHVVGGMVALNYLLFRRRATFAWRRLVTGTVATYWHFMGMVWVVLFVVLMAL